MSLQGAATARPASPDHTERPQGTGDPLSDPGAVGPVETVRPPAPEPLIHGAGHTEADWSRCLWLQDMATVSLPSLLMGRRRLVVVAPHPDDEVLGCGGLMWTARQAGLEVVVVSVTRGEACYPGEDTAELSRLRHEELRRAVGELGLLPGDIESVGVPDGAVSAFESAVEDALARIVRHGDLVLATWDHDGHPDHEAAGRAARRAATTRGARYASYPVWAWHWLDPGAGRQRFSGGVRFGLSEDARDAKARAIARFDSQLKAPPSHAPVLPPHVVARFARPFEVFLP